MLRLLLVHVIVGLGLRLELVELGSSKAMGLAELGPTYTICSGAYIVCRGTSGINCRGCSEG